MKRFTISFDTYGGFYTPRKKEIEDFDLRYSYDENDYKIIQEIMNDQEHIIYLRTTNFNMESKSVEWIKLKVISSKDVGLKKRNYVVLYIKKFEKHMSDYDSVKDEV